MSKAKANKSYLDKLKDPRWQRKRLQVLERDNFTCQLCGDTKTELHIHHKKYAAEPWQIDNSHLITYCCYCHHAVEEMKEFKAIPLFARKVKAQRMVLMVRAIMNNVEVVYLFKSMPEGKVEYMFGMTASLYRDLSDFMAYNPKRQSKEENIRRDVSDDNSLPGIDTLKESTTSANIQNKLFEKFPEDFKIQEGGHDGK